MPRTGWGSSGNEPPTEGNVWGGSSSQKESDKELIARITALVEREHGTPTISLFFSQPTAAIRIEHTKLTTKQLGVVRRAAGL